MTKPLVRGGVYQGVRYDDKDPAPNGTSYITTTPPEVYDDSIIVAAASPNVARGHPEKDGWFLSDFYAFNYLFHGISKDQTWLTAAVSAFTHIWKDVNYRN